MTTWQNIKPIYIYIQSLCIQTGHSTNINGRRFIDAALEPEVLLQVCYFARLATQQIKI